MGNLGYLNMKCHSVLNSVEYNGEELSFLDHNSATFWI